jgi:DNA-binding CsgD family transcriptional regulator
MTKTLTDEQAAVLDLMASGLVAKRIASAMGITVVRVHSLTKEVRHKLEAKTNEQACFFFGAWRADRH